MSADFAELDYRKTPLGELTLRRRRVLALDGLEVFEVKLGDAFLMSSLFHEVEVALADLGLAAVNAPEMDVVVGGLGLGYTALAALQHSAVRSLIVVEALDPVIDWHQRGLVPLGPQLAADPRCRFVLGDFYHSPKNLLHARHGAFYEADGLRRLAAQLHPQGVFALWSDDPPDAEFLETLRAVFIDVEARIVSFFNPLLERDSASTVYIARKA